MMKDPFANYVVQKMLDVADSAHRKKMMFAIKGHIPALRKFNYGKHIISEDLNFLKFGRGNRFENPIRILGIFLSKLNIFCYK